MSAILQSAVHTPDALGLSRRIQAIRASPTLAVTMRAARLKAEGRDIIGFGAGEPDFDTPEHIKQAAIEALRKGQTKYTAVGGTPGLKSAVIAKFKRDNGLDYTAKQILVSCGGKHSSFNLALAFLNPGDEVVIPAPYWVSYSDIALVAEAKPVLVSAGIEQGFRITPAQLAAAITPRTRMFLINTPSNPSGVTYSLEELTALGEVLRKHPQILIVTDDMYEHILMQDKPFANILNACPDLYSRTMVLNGVSKVYAMTGWRIGYAAGPEHIITAMENAQSHSTSNPCSISQAAAEAALNGPQDCIAPMVKAFRERHAFVVDGLNKVPGIKCLPAGGAFYAFPDARGAIASLHARGRIAQPNDLALTEYMLEHAGVAFVPGSAFGMDGYFRLSFATSMANLEQGIARIHKAVVE